MIKALGLSHSLFSRRRLLSTCFRRVHLDSIARNPSPKAVEDEEVFAQIPDWCTGDALHLFDAMPQEESFHLLRACPQRNRETTNAVIIRIAKEGYKEEVLEVFRRMHVFGITPTKHALSTVLHSCSKLFQLSLGLQVHAQVLRTGHESNLFISSALVDLYAKCGLIVDARTVFSGMPKHDQVSWTSIISGYAQNLLGEEAFQLFVDMRHSGIKPNCFTFASLVSACTGLASLDLGKQVHAQAIIVGFDEDTFVMNSLLDMYAKCGDIEHASFLFESKLEKDIVMYNSLIVGYAQNLCSEESLRLFVQLQYEGMNPDSSTFAGVLNACGSLAVLRQGKHIHSLIIKTGLDLCIFVTSSLIDMYSKCGSIEDARCVFDQTQEKNCVLVTTMITAYAQNGKGQDAVELFEQLVKAGMKPDRICFTAVLTACNHGGLLDKAIQYFKSMQTCEGLMPELDHYACMVDLYGRNGQLLEAWKLIDQMPMKPNSVIWTSLLGSCKIHGDTELGKKSAENIRNIEPRSAAPYVTVSNAYAEEGMWNEAAEVRKLMKDRGLKKRVGCSWIEVDKKVHIFTISDISHPQSREIYLALDNVILEMRDAWSVRSLTFEQQVGISTKETKQCHLHFVDYNCF